MFKIFEIMKNPSYLGAFLQYGSPPTAVTQNRGGPGNYNPRRSGVVRTTRHLIFHARRPA